jgi:hypothetical protein
MRRLLVLCLAGAATACNLVETSGPPLSEAECTQLIDKIHATFAEGLTGEDLEEYNSYDDRDESIAECVADPAWDRAGFECAMKADGEAALQLCALRNRG